MINDRCAVEINIPRYPGTVDGRSSTTILSSQDTRSEPAVSRGLSKLPECRRKPLTERGLPFLAASDRHGENLIEVGCFFDSREPLAMSAVGAGFAKGDLQ